KAVVPSMTARGGGRIVNIASNTVLKGAPGLLHYVASKGAVIAFTRALAREVGPAGITVNAIAPGFTLSDGVKGNPAYVESFRASGDAAFVTGQTLVVDGGNVLV